MNRCGRHVLLPDWLTSDHGHGNSTLLNVSKLLPDYTASYLRKNDAVLPLPRTYLLTNFRAFNAIADVLSQMQTYDSNLTLRNRQRLQRAQQPCGHSQRSLSSRPILHEVLDKCYFRCS
jgi:hypothetical protein